MKDSHAASLDITGAEYVEIQISENGKVLWINTKFGCKLRINEISRISIRDFRAASPQGYPRDQFDFIMPGAHHTFTNCSARQAANTIRARFPRYAHEFTCRTVNSVCHIYRRARAQRGLLKKADQ